MFLAIDVGNTQTHLGVFEGEELVDDWRFATGGDDTADELAARISALLGLCGHALGQIDSVAISSVVPRCSVEYARLCRRYLGREGFFVQPGVSAGMPIRSYDPRELGPDRLVNAIAAYDALGGPCVAVDCGTAIKFDAVSAEGEYLGGVIAPGVRVSMEALSRNAARLTAVDFAAPEAAIGTSTDAALRSGMVYGFAGAIDAIAERIRAELGGSAGFIATGGIAGQVVPHCRTIERVDEHLTLTGLRLVHALNS